MSKFFFILMALSLTGGMPLISMAEETAPVEKVAVTEETAPIEETAMAEEEEAEPECD